VERVVGIGGVFLRARDADSLGAWYSKHLGIELTEWGGHVFEAEEGDVTVWSLFPADTDYFGPRDRQAMVNYRVRDLDAMLEQLRAAGVEVDDSVQDDENGRFGWATDPEGNRIELWEPRRA
jgi:predicted enzyme related to lactoylglutathione lyase